jgi:hypothetical protein
MGDVHQLILRQGIDQARRQAETKHERSLVEAAYQVLSEDADRIGFTYSGFALTSLPHKPQTTPVWRREGAGLTLVLEAGHDRAGKPIGVPYGAYARFILLYLQSQAVKSHSREIQLGRSMRVWLSAMGMSIGGTTYRMVNEQARRISGCRLTFYADRSSGEVMRHGGFVDGAISLADDSAQGHLWQERVLLNQQFYEALLAHPVPVSEAALKAIGPRSMVIDVYIWLAYRLHALRTDTPVSWLALNAQFGGGFGLLRKFRAHFLECLALALAAYPDARVSVGEAGLVLHPSRPAIATL